MPLMLPLSYILHSAQLHQPPSPCWHSHSTHCTTQHGLSRLWCGALRWWGLGEVLHIIPVPEHQMGLWLHSPGARALSPCLPSSWALRPAPCLPILLSFPFLSSSSFCLSHLTMSCTATWLKVGATAGINCPFEDHL